MSQGQDNLGELRNALKDIFSGQYKSSGVASIQQKLSDRHTAVLEEIIKISERHGITSQGGVEPGTAYLYGPYFMEVLKATERFSKSWVSAASIATGIGIAARPDMLETLLLAIVLGSATGLRQAIESGNYPPKGV